MTQPVPPPSRHPRRFMTLTLVLVLLLGAFVTLRQLGIIGDSSLVSFRGRVCTIYLRVESDPRAGRASSSGTAQNGIDFIENVPMSVHGTIRRVAADGIIVDVDNAQVWVPLARVQTVVARPATATR